MDYLKNFVSRFFAVILMFFALIGFIVPYPGEAASYLILIFLFTIIFASYFQADLKFPNRYEIKQILIFAGLRYLIIPLIVLLVVKELNVFLAYALFFLFMMPAGVSSPAITNLLGGNFNLSMRILILSSFIVTFFLPPLSSLFAGSHLDVSYNKLFFTLLFTVILPFFLHLPVRKVKVVKKFMIDHLSLIAVTCLSVIFMLAIAKNKEGILGNPGKLPLYFLISFVVYSFLYLSGYFLRPREIFRNRLTLSVSSGLNNVGLGLSLSILYLSPEMTVFFIVSEIVWVTIMIPVKYIFRKKMKFKNH